MYSFASNMQARMSHQFQPGNAFSARHNSHLPQFGPPVRDGLIQTTSWPTGYTVHNQMFTVDVLQDLLLLYEHSMACLGDCGQFNCRHMKQNLNHIIRCRGQCNPVCQSYMNLFSHYIGCIASTCAVCPDVRRRLVCLQINHAKHWKINHGPCTRDGETSNGEVTRPFVHPQQTSPQCSNLKRTLDHDPSSGVLNPDDNVESPITASQSLNKEESIEKNVGISRAKRRKIKHDSCAHGSRMLEGEVTKHFTPTEQTTFLQSSNLKRSLDRDVGSEIMNQEDILDSPQCLNKEEQYEKDVEPICTEVIEDHGPLSGLKDISTKDNLEIEEMKEWENLYDMLGKMNEEESENAYQIFPSNDIQTLEEPLEMNDQNAAKDLPRTKLSNHIEQRIFSSLKKERQQRASTLGMNINEVPTAENLVVREVSSIDKALKVRPEFLKMFEAGKYPSEYNYKSKAIVLFQTIDDYDVILFVMYSQEYGPECSEQNRRRVYISYIDSVKFLTPEIKTVTGEALRTFVYHEFLIGYLDYCKKRLFTSCHIWSSPPSENIDYILYGHPKAQKIPKPDQLHQWYHNMIKKASEDNIVVEHTNLYDHFFVKKSEAQISITAGHLPHFEGDFLPELILYMLPKGGEKISANNYSNSRAARERMLRADKHNASSIANEKDLLQMKRIGDAINPTKENFIILHLYPICKSCYQTITDEQWVCNTCKDYYFCSGCHALEKVLQHNDRHPSNAKKKHSFHKVMLEGSLGETSDEDGSIHYNIFETRLDLLDFCVGNGYQFGTLDQAQRSTYIILNYLHTQNPTRPPQSD